MELTKKHTSKKLGSSHTMLENLWSACKPNMKTLMFILRLIFPQIVMLITSCACIQLEKKENTTITTKRFSCCSQKKKGPKTFNLLKLHLQIKKGFFLSLKAFQKHLIRINTLHEDIWEPLIKHLSGTPLTDEFTIA